jgi:hypothetical protein
LARHPDVVGQVADKLEPGPLGHLRQPQRVDLLLDGLLELRALAGEPGGMAGVRARQHHPSVRGELPPQLPEQRLPPVERHVLDHVEESDQLERPAQVELGDVADVELDVRYEHAGELDGGLAEIDAGDLSEAP